MLVNFIFPLLFSIAFPNCHASPLLEESLHSFWYKAIPQAPNLWITSPSWKNPIMPFINTDFQKKSSGNVCPQSTFSYRWVRKIRQDRKIIHFSPSLSRGRKSQKIKISYSSLDGIMSFMINHRKSPFLETSSFYRTVFPTRFPCSVFISKLSTQKPRGEKNPQSQLRPIHSPQNARPVHVHFALIGEINVAMNLGLCFFVIINENCLEVKGSVKAAVGKIYCLRCL